MDGRWIPRLGLEDLGFLPFTGSVLGAATKGHSDDTAGEGDEQSVMVLIQLQSQDSPVLLTLNIAPGYRDRDREDMGAATADFGARLSASDAGLTWRGRKR